MKCFETTAGNSDTQLKKRAAENSPVERTNSKGTGIHLDGVAGCGQNPGAAYFAPTSRSFPIAKACSGCSCQNGHIEWAKQTQWIEKKPEAHARWNNDHQPHPEFW
jgi:hypothetical protein